MTELLKDEHERDAERANIAHNAIVRAMSELSWVAHHPEALRYLDSTDAINLGAVIGLSRRILAGANGRGHLSGRPSSGDHAPDLPCQPNAKKGQHMKIVLRLAQIFLTPMGILYAYVLAVTPGHNPLGALIWTVAAYIAVRGSLSVSIAVGHLIEWALEGSVA